MPNRVLAAVISSLALLSSALADDWVAVKLRGQVLQLVGDQWQPLRRGDVVADDRPIRTLKSGRVEFQRDEETVSLGPDTQIQIHDKVGQRFTTVTQQFGKVEIEAEVQNVQHFAVKTSYLVAVVKGTRFVVTVGKGWSNVDVQRGHVAVESEVTHSSTVIAKGQSATATASAELSVSGKGDLPPVVVANGKIISEGGKAPTDAKEAAALEKAAVNATGDQKPALEKAAKEADKAAKETNKSAEKAEKKADKAQDKNSHKAAEKAQKPADKAADKAKKDANKAAEKDSKDAKKSSDSGKGDSGKGKK